MQWISVGSGIEHAEGGGTPIGQVEQGFQIWCNSPGVHKMDDPRYGTEDPSSLVHFKPTDNVQIRVLAGNIGDMKGKYLYSL
jgi:redox-sensitive bicupin YhaK (pirin superfamily)